MKSFYWKEGRARKLLLEKKKKRNNFQFITESFRPGHLLFWGEENGRVFNCTDYLTSADQEISN